MYVVIIEPEHPLRPPGYMLNQNEIDWGGLDSHMCVYEVERTMTLPFQHAHFHKMQGSRSYTHLPPWME